MAPRDGHSEALLARRGVGGAGADTVQSVSQAVEHGPDRQHPDSRRRELDRQGQAIQPPGNIGDDGHVLR